MALDRRDNGGASPRRGRPVRYAHGIFSDQARRDRRRRHRPRGRRRGAQGAPGRERRASTPTGYDLGAQRWHRTGETLPDSVLAEIRGARRDPARGGRRPDRAQRRARTGPAAAAALRARPVRQPAPGPALPRGGHPAGRASGPSRSTCWWSGKAPRAPTPGPAVCCARAPRSEVATQESLNTAFGVAPGGPVRVRAGRRAAAPEADPGAQDQRAGLRRGPVAAHGRGAGQGVQRDRGATTATWTPRPCSSSPSRSAST